MDDRNTPQFTTGELLYALDGLKREQGRVRSHIQGLVENLHEANARGGAEEVQTLWTGSAMTQCTLIG